MADRIIQYNGSRTFSPIATQFRKKNREKKLELMQKSHLYSKIKLLLELDFFAKSESRTKFSVSGKKQKNILNSPKPFLMQPI